MAGRHQLPLPNPYNQPHSKPSGAGDGILSHRPTVGLEDRAALQHREIQTLLHDNKRLAATHVGLKHELAAAQKGLRALAAAAAAAKADGDARVREVFERSVKAEAEARLADVAAAELDRVRGDARTLGAALDVLVAEMKEVEGELAVAREGSKQVRDVKSEIDSVRREIQKGRAAIELEKKIRVRNNEFRKAMEEKMDSMAVEIEKLQANLGNADGRPNPNTGYGGAQPYLKPYNLQRVQSVGESNAEYGSGPMLLGSGKMQQPNMYR